MKKLVNPAPARPSPHPAPADDCPAPDDLTTCVSVLNNTIREADELLAAICASVGGHPSPGQSESTVEGEGLCGGVGLALWQATAVLESLRRLAGIIGVHPAR